MITPRFQVTQTENTVTIVIRAPYCNLRDLEVCVEDNVYLFVCKPYYLRLNLPGNIVENDHTKSSFNSDTGEFSFTYDKTVLQEYFEDLDLITKLMPVKLDVVEGDRKIEILTSETVENVNNVMIDIEHGYGFALRGGYSFNTVSGEFNEVFDTDPFKNTLAERRNLRLHEEKEKFNIDHYLGDMMDDEEINELCNLKDPYSSILKDAVVFTEKELDFLKDLPNIQYNLNAEQIKYCHNSLIDILFAYCYDRRTTFYEGTCESGWTIVKLSSSLSWFEAFDSSKEAAIAAFRRCLIYPLYRNFNLSNSILQDLKTLLSLGEKMLIKCLINIYEIFLGGDCGRYILNNLFIKDYITYVMKWDKDLWLNTVSEVQSLKLHKDDLGLNLEQIEALGNEDLPEKMLKLNIKENETDSDDETSQSEDTENSSSEGTDSSSEESSD